MATYLIELQRVVTAYKLDGQIQLQGSVLSQPAARDDSPTSFVSMTPETARTLVHLLQVALDGLPE